MSNNPVVGSAFVEVHARAANNLESEIRIETERAAARVQASTPAASGSQSVQRAERTYGVDSREAAAEREAFAARGAAFDERIAAQRAAAAEKAESKIRKEIKDTSDEHERASRRVQTSTARTTSSLLQGAAAYAVTDAAVRAITGTLGAFLQAGDAGRLKSEADVRAYREMANGLDDLGQAWEDAKLRIGGFIATDINPFSTKFRKGVEALHNPLDTLSALLGRTTNGTRDLAEAFAEIDAANPSRTIRETEEATRRAEEVVADAQDRFDARTEATVRAVGADYALSQANERLTEAQDRVNKASTTGAEVARQLADAERAVREARESAADAAQNAIERDRDLAEARRNLTETSFRTGSQSQDTLDAADAVQSAEEDARRAHEEAGDAVADVARAEQDAAKVRVRSTEDQERALKALRDAQRDVAGRTADLAVAQQQAAGGTVTATDKLRLYSTELGKFSEPGGAGPTFRTEIESIQRALENLQPILAPWVTPDVDAALAARAPAAAAAYEASRTGSNLNLGPDLGAGAVGAGAVGGTSTVTINNIYNTPVDPAQVAQQQAAQIGGGSATHRVI